MNGVFRRAALWFLLITLLGTALGFAWGILASNSIAQSVAREDPNDPLDMLHVVVLMYSALGFAGGLVLGSLVASLVYLTKKNELGDRMLQEQGMKS